jgi:hypothetical protein
MRSYIAGRLKIKQGGHICLTNKTGIPADQDGVAGKETFALTCANQGGNNMAGFLNKEMADALCTVIALGFMQSNSRAPEGNEKTQFQFSEPNPKLGPLVDFINTNFGIGLTVTEAAPQSDMPCIIAKTKFTPNPILAEGVVEDFWPYITKINNKLLARDSHTAAYGAYIGGRSVTAATDIIGPSALDTYKGVYRMDSAGVAESYKKARVQAKNATDILKDSTLRKGKTCIRYDANCCNLPDIGPDIGQGQLFHSYHGMIRAMVEIPPTSIEKDAVYFEIALGVNTDKVSSCIPLQHIYVR